MKTVEQKRKDRKVYYERNKEKLLKIQKKYYDKNSEKIKKASKEYRKNNKDKVSKNKKNYYELNREKISENKKKYYIKNKKEIIEKNRIRAIKKRKEDVLYKLKGNIKCLIHQSFRRNKYIKRNRTEQILGCSIEQFRIYLENKFESWMSWENYGLYNGQLNFGWDIDHIISLSNAKTEEDVIKLNHYTNLQPLCSKINRDIKKDL